MLYSEDDGAKIPHIYCEGEEHLSKIAVYTRQKSYTT